MKRIRTAAFIPAALLACVLAASVRIPGAGADSRRYLPDSTVLARVDNRVIRVYDFRDLYFTVDAATRAASDSAGRVEFLKTLINKDVMGLTALALNHPLDPSDQRTMRQHMANMLKFMAYRIRTRDPVVVTEKELRQLYEEQAWELRLRYLLMADEATARRVRGQLARGRITWREAALRYSLGPDSLRDGDLGWRSRNDLGGAPAAVVFKLRPPGFSEVTRDPEGFRIWQCLGRRPAEMPAYLAIRKALLIEVRADRENELRRKFMAELSARAKPRYDTTAVIWLADKFRLANAGIGTPSTAGLDLRSRIPVISQADTGRILATTGDRRMTCGQFTAIYHDIPPLGRPRIQTPEALFAVLQQIVLEPAVMEYAKAQSLESNPEVVAELAKKREGLLVQRLYADSVEAKISVTEPMRQQYFKTHQREYVSRERVRYALIPRLTEAGADSVMARLKAGEPPQAILAADSLTGMTRGSIREVLEGQPHAYRGLLFEELRAGESGKQHLDQDQLWVVFHVISHDRSRPLSYAESRDMVDQAVENTTAETLLGGLIARLRARHRIVSHPELLQQIHLVDPSNESNLPSGN